MAKSDLSNKIFGRLRVIKQLPERSKQGYVVWECLCDPNVEGCGKIISVISSNLTRKRVTSCGCWKVDYNTKHGLHDVPEYNIWKGIKQRCYNEKHHKYKSYGGRGIAMSEDWYCDFEIFYQDMGPRPSPELSIDRRENDKGYSKENCHWATKVEQSNNTRTNIFYERHGVFKTLAAWCKELSMNYYVAYGRLKLGWSLEKALTTPSK